jgi:hypothetical protein
VDFERLAAGGFATLPRDYTTLAMLTMLASVCGVLDDQQRAARLHERLLPYAGCQARIGRIGTGTFGPVDHYLGLLATTLQRWDAAAAHYEAAIEWCVEAAAAPFLANSRYQYARMLLSRGRPGDQRRARDQLDAARAGARMLGIRLQLDVPDADTAQVRCFRRDGDYWTIGYGGRPFQLRHSVGLGYLAELLAHPGRELHALDLGGGRPAAGGDAGPLLDDAAKAAYRSRLDELAADLDEAEAWADPERAARAREEIEALRNELARAIGLGGRARVAASDAERARVRVTKAIRSSMARIAEHDPALGEHLRRTVRTGLFCSYTGQERLLSQP